MLSTVVLWPFNAGCVCAVPVPGCQRRPGFLSRGCKHLSFDSKYVALTQHYIQARWCDASKSEPHPPNSTQYTPVFQASVSGLGSSQLKLQLSTNASFPEDCEYQVGIAVVALCWVLVWKCENIHKNCKNMCGVMGLGVSSFRGS